MTWLRGLFGGKCEGDRMTCPACGGTMRMLPSEDAAVCRKCRRRQTGKDMAAAAKAEPPTPPKPEQPPMPLPYDPFGIDADVHHRMEKYYLAHLAGVVAKWDRASPRPPSRGDGMDPANAYLICGECHERWDFPDLALGDCVLLPCQHGFLLRDEQAAGKAKFYGPGADYRVTMEPPE